MNTSKFSAFSWPAKVRKRSTGTHLHVLRHILGAMTRFSKSISLSLYQRRGTLLSACDKAKTPPSAAPRISSSRREGAVSFAGLRGLGLCIAEHNKAPAACSHSETAEQCPRRPCRSAPGVPPVKPIFFTRSFNSGTMRCCSFTTTPSFCIFFAVAGRPPPCNPSRSFG